MKTVAARGPSGTDGAQLIYRVLGPLEVTGEAGPIPLGGAKQRAVLALLLLNANCVVSRERLIDELWGEDPPETAVTTIQVYVSRLRKVLPPETLVTRPPGYLLTADPEAIDLQRFEKLAADARAAAPERAARLLRNALSLWRGPPLAEFDEPFARIEGGRLEHARVAALEQRIEADLARGRHEDLVGELEAVIAEHPHRERLRGQLMLALYRTGRQAEALAAYRDARAQLDEFGIEPSPRLRELERAILTQDETLTPPAPLVAGAVELPGPLRAVSPFPFVGRTKELETLRSALALAEQGEGGQVALVGGEAGSGKTRLARELAREAAARGTLVLYGSAHADVNMPYQPFVEALEFLVRVADPAALDTCIGEGHGDLARLLPRLATPAPAVDDPQTARRRLHNAVGDLLARVGRERPVFVVVDDIHWADSASAELLRHLARSAPEMRLCLLATYRERSEDIRPGLAPALYDLTRLEGVIDIGLDALSEEDIGEFIARSSGAKATTELTESIGKLTDGTPFLLCELWRALSDTRSVEISDAGVRLVQPLGELSSPESVRHVVRYRISRLAPETTAMLEVAAVAGPQFELGLLGNDDATISAAEEAVESGMIEASSQTGVAHRFTHELVRRALYDRLSSVRRAELHLHVGEALERAYSRDPTPVVADLAHHFTSAVALAGTTRALAYNVLAARTAITSLAFEEASKRLMTAIGLGIDEDVVGAVCDLACALMDSRSLAEAEMLLSAAIEAADGVLNENVRADLAVIRGYVRLRTDPSGAEEIRIVARESIRTFRPGDHRAIARAWRLLSFISTFECRWSDVEEALRHALEHAQDGGDRREQTTVVSWLAAALYNGPTPAGEAIRQCKSLLAQFADDPVVRARTGGTLAVLLAMTGRIDDARETVRATTAALDARSLRTPSAVARAVMSEVEMLAGDPVTAGEQLIAAHRDLEQAGEQTIAIAAAFEVARALCVQGEFAEAERWMAPRRKRLDSCDLMVRAVGLSVEAHLAGRAGRIDDAMHLARRATAIVEPTDALNVRAEALGSLSRVLALAGRSGEADKARADAFRLYEAKGNVVAAAQLRTMAASVAASA